MIDEEGWFSPEFDPADFRRAAARYVKFLIRARWKVDPDFLTRSELLAWGLQDIDREHRESWQLMRQAAEALAILNRDYLPRCDSGGVRPVRLETPVARLIDELAFLVQVEGGAPELNQKLLDAAAVLQRDGQMDWGQLVNWSKLPAIRPDLNQLPEPKKGGAAADPVPTQNIFKYNGDSCQICYGASGVKAIHKPLIGLFYIWYMLRHAPDLLSAADLLQARWRYCRPEDLTSSDDEFDKPVESFHRRRKDTDTTRFEDEMRQEITNLTAEMRAAQAVGRVAEATKLEKDIVKIEQELRNQRFQGMRETELEKMAKNQRNNVKKAIERARVQIGSVSAELSRHLEAAINTKGGFQYAPEINPVWET